MGNLPAFNVKDGNGSLSKADSLPNRVPHPSIVSGFRNQTVHNQFYEVRLIAVKGHLWHYVLDFPVYPNLHITAFP